MISFTEPVMNWVSLYGAYLHLLTPTPPTPRNLYWISTEKYGLLPERNNDSTINLEIKFVASYHVPPVNQFTYYTKDNQQ